MTADAVLDAAKLIAAGGTAVWFVVQLAKAYVGTSPRGTVAVSAATAAVLTVLYAVQNGVLDFRHAFDLVAAAISLAAFGSGINRTATATEKG